MGIWRTEESVITDAGNDLLAKLSADGKPLIFTSARAGSALSPSVSELRKLTELESQKQVLILGSLEYVGTSKCNLEVVLENSTVTEVYSCSQIGVYAQSDSSTESDILFAVMQAYEPDAIPTNESPVIIRHRLILSYGNVDEVRVLADFHGIATTDYVDAQIQTREPVISEKKTAFNKDFAVLDTMLKAPSKTPFIGESDQVPRIDHVHPAPSVMQYAEDSWTSSTKTQMITDTNTWQMRWSGTVNSNGGWSLDVTFDETWNAYVYEATSVDLDNLRGKTLEWGVSSFVGATGRLEVVVGDTMIAQLNEEILTGLVTIPADAQSFMVRAIVFGSDLNVKFTGLYVYDVNEDVEVPDNKATFVEFRKVLQNQFPKIATSGVIYITEKGGMYLGLNNGTLLPLGGSEVLT